MKSDNSLKCSQNSALVHIQSQIIQSTTCPYPEPDTSSPLLVALQSQRKSVRCWSLTSAKCIQAATGSNPQPYTRISTPPYKTLAMLKYEFCPPVCPEVAKVVFSFRFTDENLRLSHFRQVCSMSFPTSCSPWFYFPVSVRWKVENS